MPYTPLQMADAFIQTGELADALDALNQHLAANPGDDSARRLRVGVQMRLGSDDALQAALADLDALTEPTPTDRVQRSIIYERLGDLDHAARAIEHSGDDRQTERLLHLLTQQGKLTEALELVRAQPRVWRWLQWEGDLLVLAGDDYTAIARYGLALAQIDERFDVHVDTYLAPIKARILLARGHAYRRLQQPEQAEAHYVEAAQLIPSDPSIPFYRGLLAAERGDEEIAVSLCRAGLASSSDTMRADMMDLLSRQYNDLLQKIEEKP